MNLSARSRKEDVSPSGDLVSPNYSLPTLMDTLTPGIGVSANRVPTQYGLFESIKHQRYRQALLLVEAGVNIDGRNEQGQTPLIFACTIVTDNAKLREKFIQLCLSAGADPNIQDWQGLTALMHACQLEQLETVIAIAELPHTDLTIQDQNGNTSLLYAASKGNIDIVVILLNALRQVYINLAPALEHKNLEGKRPIDLATLNNHKEVIKLLILAAESPEKILEFALPDSISEINDDSIDSTSDDLTFSETQTIAFNNKAIISDQKNHDELPRTTNVSELPNISKTEGTKEDVLKTEPKSRNNRKGTDTNLHVDAPVKSRSQKSGILPLLSLSSLDVPASEPWEWDVTATGRKLKPGKRGTITGSRSLTDSRGKLSDSPLDSRNKLFCISSDQLNASFGGFSKLDGTSAPFQRFTSTEYLSNLTNKEGLHLPPIKASLTNHQKMTKTSPKNLEENGTEQNQQ